MSLPREEIGGRSTVPQDIAGYVRLGIRVVREVCKDAMCAHIPYRKREAARWLLTCEGKDEGTLGWWLDHLGACSVSFPPRHSFREIGEESLMGVRWKRDTGGVFSKKILPDGAVINLHMVTRTKKKED